MDLLRNFAMALSGMKVIEDLDGLQRRKRKYSIIFSSSSFGYFIYSVINFDSFVVY